jgi:hypothetical protein
LVNHDNHTNHENQPRKGPTGWSAKEVFLS